MAPIAGRLDYQRPAEHGALTLAGGPVDIAEGPAAAVVCAIDGYVDNAGELASELGIGGSPSPERVVARGYARWGEGVLERLRGDFAVLAWDRETQRGLIACDQFGARSMFVRSAGSRLSLASE